jgi:hypothetical protein
VAASTGIVLSIGAITVANRTVFNGQPMDWRPVIATGIVAVMLSGAETMIGPEIPRALAMVALVTVVFSRVDPRVPSPAESALNWYNKR